MNHKHMLVIANVMDCQAEKGNREQDIFERICSKYSKPRVPTVYEYLREVGKQLGQEKSFYTFDLADILYKNQLWKQSLPNVDPFYAVKANADPILVRLFVLLGYGFDCSTQGEIQLVLDAGADPKRIIFAHTIKTHGALKYAASVGVDLMTFDCEEELVKIHKFFPNARLILRLKSKSTQTVYNLSKKFGASVSQAESLLLKAKELKLNVIGTSFHVGGVCGEPEIYTSSIDDSRAVFDIAKRLGFHFTIANIGAGFFGSKEKEDFFRTLTQKINASLQENFPDGNTTFMAEPGCFCVCSAVTLTTAIIGKKSTLEEENEDKGIQKQYYVNDGFYGAFFENKEVYDVNYKPLLTTSELKRRPVFKSKFWGLTCCSEDLVLEECLLPDMEEGEFVVWENMGAYSRGVYSTFTCIPYPASRYIFIKNPRLKLEYILNLEEVMDFIAKTATLVESDEYKDGSRS